MKAKKIKLQSGHIDIRDAFFDSLYEIAKADSDVIFLTADMGAFSLEKFKQDLPCQYMNIGIAEQNLISVAAGLTLGGKKVFIYGIAPFVTLRCYEQIKVDLGGMRLPVTIIGTGPGVAYSSDGLTHQATQDVSIMRAIPGMVIFSPSEPLMAVEVARMAYQSKSPVYIRLDKGKLPLLYSDHDFLPGLKLLKKGRDILIIATGIMVHQALAIAKNLSLHSIDAGVIDLYRIKPLNEKLLVSFIKKSKKIVTIEEHSIIGGIGSAVSELLTDKELKVSIKRIGILDTHCVGYGDRDWTQTEYGLDRSNVIKVIKRWVSK